MGKERMSTAEVAKILGCNQEAVRQHIKQGIWNFGDYIPKQKTGSKRDKFFIYRRKFYQHIGYEEGVKDVDAEKKTQTA